MGVKLFRGHRGRHSLLPTVIHSFVHRLFVLGPSEGICPKFEGLSGQTQTICTKGKSPCLPGTYRRYLNVSLKASEACLNSSSEARVYDLLWMTCGQTWDIDLNRLCAA